MNTELKEFQDSFTIEQKIAVIHCLIIVAQCDRELHPNELHSIKLSAKNLGVDFDINNLSSLMLEMFKQDNIPILNTLNKNQKEWYIIAMHTLIHADEKIEEKEVQYSLGIASEIGISANEYKEILDRIDLIYNTFNN